MPHTPAHRIALFAILFTAIAHGPESPAPLENRDTLKAYFETGDIPTQGQFADLIDSFIDLQFDYGNSSDLHTVTALRGGIAVDASGNALRLSAGQVFDPAAYNLAQTASLGASSDWPGGSGFLAFNFEIDDNGSATSHNGFVEMSVDGPTDTAPYALRLVSIGYETTPDAAVTMTPIPEPTTFALLAATSLLIIRRQRNV